MKKKKNIIEKRKIISFKSFPIYYNKEKLGLKKNTVRDTNDWSNDRWQEYLLATHVKIELPGDPIEYFIREITDKTEYLDFAIISW